MSGDADHDLIVTDGGPLITLALADRLDALMAPGVRLVIPDAVWVEAAKEDAPGASAMIEWMARNDGRVRLQPTEVGLDQLRRIRDGRSIRGMGEAAALEILNRSATLHPERHRSLVVEDGVAEKRTAIMPEGSYVISVGNWLRAAKHHR